jgi:hypothetical protein
VVAWFSAGFPTPPPALDGLLASKPWDIEGCLPLGNLRAPSAPSAVFSGNEKVAKVKDDSGVRISSKAGTLGSAAVDAGALPIGRTEASTERLNAAELASLAPTPTSTPTEDASPAGRNDRPTPEA